MLYWASAAGWQFVDMAGGKETRFLVIVRDFFSLALALLIAVQPIRLPFYHTTNLSALKNSGH